MRIQTKLFLLLLVIAIVPLVALNWRGERATENFGQAVVDQGRSAVVQGIENQLSQAITYSSELLTAQQRQVEIALRLQAEAASRLLSSSVSVGEAPQFYMAEDFDTPRTQPPDTELTLDHAIVSPEGAMQAVPVSMGHQAFLLAPGVAQAEVEESLLRLLPLTATYKNIHQTSEGLFYWQYVSLREGLHSAYPGHGGYPPNYDPRKRAWYASALEADGLVWTPPFFDAATRRLLLTASVPIYSVDGAQIGVTGIDVDILKVLGDIHGRVQVGENAESFIVTVSTDDGAPTLRALASSSHQDAGMSWDAMPTTMEVLSGDESGAGDLIDDLIEGRSGVRRLPYQGRQSLWVYSGLGQGTTGLLSIVPLDDIEEIAARSQSAVTEAVFEQVRLAGIALTTLIVVVALLAMLAARSVTSPLRALAMTAKGLADGNLDARASVKSSDEVGELANTFNAMIPQLRSHISVMESLTLAREVQQKLLPTSAISLPGVEFAGRCVYSEDVGGDYYDFIHFDDDPNSQRAGIVVGDVAGHGVVAALTMTSVRALLRSHAGDGRDLCVAMNAVNSHLVADSAGGRFVTLVYVVLDPSDRTIRWVSAGHGPILLYDPDREDFEELEVKDIPLGVNETWSYHECARENWPPSGLLIMGTDGVWETCNAEGQAFGKAGLMEVIRAVAHLSAEDICNKIIETLERFADGEPQRDDVTLVVAKFLPPHHAK